MAAQKLGKQTINPAALQSNLTSATPLVVQNKFEDRHPTTIQLDWVGCPPCASGGGLKLIYVSFISSRYSLITPPVNKLLMIRNNRWTDTFRQQSIHLPHHSQTPSEHFLFEFSTNIYTNIRTILHLITSYDVLSCNG